MATTLEDDPLTYTYEWKVEGVTQQTTSDVASTTDTFDLSTANFGDRGDEVTVTVTANDGIATSTPTASSTDTATVQNSDSGGGLGDDRSGVAGHEPGAVGHDRLVRRRRRHPHVRLPVAA